MFYRLPECAQQDRVLLFFPIGKGESELALGHAMELAIRRASGPAAGSTQFQFDSVNSPLGLIKAGRLKPSFVNSNVRSSLYPDIPTLKESGGPFIETMAWQGVMATLKTSSSIIDRMAREIALAMNDPQTSAAIDGLGAISIASTPAQYSSFIADQEKRFQQTVEELGLKLD